jgi:hypothetical protein
LTLLKGGPPRLYNEDQKGGFRDDRKCNKDLLLGPDFGGTDPAKAIYLPAWKRYAGRFFSKVEEESPEFWSLIANKPVEILFVSGLYGLLLWDELIQAYDCHFNDYKKDRQKQTVAEIWDGALTDALSEFVANRAGSRPIRHIFDLLSESTYQHMFNWGKIAGVQVYHRVFKGLAGPDVLPKLAMILGKELPSFCSGSKRFGYDEWYRLPGDRESSIRYGFESQIGRKLDATREGELEETRKVVLERFPRLNEVPEALERLVLAEHSWEKVRNFEAFDFGAMIVSFSKAVECYLQQVEDKKGWPDLGLLLHQLKILRSGGAHPAGQRKREHVALARSLALGIFKKGEQIRQTSG